MDLKEAREFYYVFSAQLSTILRQLAFAGIALIWLFSGGKEDPAAAAVPGDLRWPAVFIIGGLIADLLQYIAASIAWGAYGRYREKRDMADPFDAPKQINWATLAMFWLKVALIVVAYVMLLSAVIRRLG